MCKNVSRLLYTVLAAGDSGEAGEGDRGNGERGEAEREEGKRAASQEPIMVDSPSHKELKWRLVPTTNLKQSPK